MKQQSETELTKAIRAVLKTCGIFHFKHWGGPMSPKGVSDILGIMPDGRFLAIEIKKPGWNPPAPGTKAFAHHKEQSRFLDEITERGGVAFFASSIDHVIDALGLRDRFLF